MVALGKQSIESYANFEQLVGGVETLFKGSAGIVEQYAANAYKTAGLSANQYMETVTAFSASLLQSVGGDTEKAAGIADMAITDMADNANKMGTAMESIQNAYQGFAKQNYTMLDNLKLGYGGTKEEMERLLSDAEKLSGQKYDISNLNDVYEAIHVIQTELGITGTTALEASSTISGSISTMKGAWENFKVSLADPNGNVEEALQNVLSSVQTVGSNIIPVIQRLLPSIVKGVTVLVTQLGSTLPGLITTLLPELLMGAVTVIDGLIAQLPTLISTITTTVIPLIVENIPEIITSLVDSLLSNIDILIDASIELMVGLATGLIQAIPVLIEKAPEIVEKLMQAIVENAPKLILAAAEIILMLVSGISENMYEMGAAAGEIIRTIVSSMRDLLSDVVDVGKQIVTKIKEGISSAWSGLTSWFKGIWNSLFGNLTANVTVNASSSGSGRAGGLDYVPYNDYPARLHLGEAVLTAREADEWRRGQSGAGNGVVINQYIQSVPQTPVELASATEAYFEQARWVMA